jgi:hypothetical protein
MGSQLNKPLNEFGFLGKFQQDYGTATNEMFFNALLFLMSVVPGSIGFYLFISWHISGIGKIFFFKKLLEVHEKLPQNINLNTEIVSLYCQKVQDEQKTI